MDTPCKDYFADNFKGLIRTSKMTFTNKSSVDGQCLVSLHCFPIIFDTLRCTKFRRCNSNVRCLATNKLKDLCNTNEKYHYFHYVD